MTFCKLTGKCPYNPNLLKLNWNWDYCIYHIAAFKSKILKAPQTRQEVKFSEFSGGVDVCLPPPVSQSEHTWTLHLNVHKVEWNCKSSHSAKWLISYRDQNHLFTAVYPLEVKSWCGVVVTLLGRLASGLPDRQKVRLNSSRRKSCGIFTFISVGITGSILFMLKSK